MDHHCLVSRREQEKVGMYDQHIVDMEKKFETSKKHLPLLNNRYYECQGSLTTLIAIWDKRKFQLMQLGEKLI